MPYRLDSRHAGFAEEFETLLGNQDPLRPLAAGFNRLEIADRKFFFAFGAERSPASRIRFHGRRRSNSGLPQ